MAPFLWEGNMDRLSGGRSALGSGLWALDSGFQARPAERPLGSELLGSQRVSSRRYPFTTIFSTGPNAESHEPAGCVFQQPARVRPQDRTRRSVPATCLSPTSVVDMTIEIGVPGNGAAEVDQARASDHGRALEPRPLVGPRNPRS